MVLEDKLYTPFEVLQYATEFAESINHKMIETSVSIALRKAGVLKSTMSLADAYREAGSRRRVDGAIKRHKLKVVKKGASVIINRDDFEGWMKKDEFDRS